MVVNVEETLENYRLITENANDLIRVLNDRLEIEYINESAHLEILGYFKDELIGKVGAIPIHPKEYSDARRFLIKVFKNGQAMRTGRIQHKNGNWIWVEIKGKAFKDKYGNQKAIMVSRDITERVQTELKLRKESERAELYLNLAGVILVALNKEGIITLMNKKGYEVLEYEEGKLIGKNWFETCLPSTLKDEVSEVFNQLIRGEFEPVEYFENPIITKNGEEKIIEWHNAVLYDDIGNIGGILSSGEDITEKKESKQKLKESESKYRGLVNNISDIIYELDINGKCSYVSHQILDISGFSQEELIGQNVFKFVHPDDLIKVAEEVKISFNNHDNRYLEFRLRHKDGHYVQVSSRFSSITIGEKQKLTGVLVDITEGKKVEQKLRESEEKYRTLTNNIPGMVYRGRTDWSVDVITNSESICGYSPDEFNSQKVNWQDIIHPDDKERLLKESSTLSERPIELTQIYRIIAKDGTIRWVNEQKMSVFTNDGIYGGVDGVVYNITNQKVAEEKLKESEEKFRTIAEQSLMGICIAQDNKMKYINKKYADIWGYSIEEMMDWQLKDAANALHPDDRDFVLEQFAKKQRGEQDIVAYYSYRGIKKSGEIIWVDQYSKTINYRGRPADLVTLLDITKKLEADQKLKESEEKYRSLFENTIEGIAIHDIIYDSQNKPINYVIRDVNPQFEKHLSLKKEDVINKEATEAYQVDEAPYLDIYSNIAETMEPTVFETYFPPMDKHFSISVFSTKKRSFVTVFEDITNRKKAEQNLKESEEKFRTIAEQSLIGIGIVQDNRIKYINKKFADMLGYTAEEILNWSPKEFLKTVHPDDREMISEQAEKKQEGLNDYLPHYQFRAIKKSSEIIWIDNYTRSIPYGGRPADLVAFIDITEKKRIEEELIKLNKLKSELLTRSSHELKTPLMSIKGFTELLLLKYNEVLNDEESFLINEIRKGCTRLETLIKDILKTADLESGSVIVKKSENDLAKLIRTCLNDLKGFADSRNHTVNLMIHDELNTNFEKRQIRQALNNILSNAIKYTPPYGKIDIKSQIGNNFIIISIKDTGIGFNEEEKGQLFKPFGKIERFGQGYDVITEGSGLGLYISKKIIELHGGDVWAESEGRNKGSTFYFSLPIPTS